MTERIYSNCKAIRIAAKSILSASTNANAASITSAATSGKEHEKQCVLTLVMKVEYNGFCYAGFQRQTATIADDNSLNYITGSKSAKRKRATCDDSAPSSHTNTKTSVFPNTIQHQLEMAIQKYTNLSLSTLRLRGAGRTDAGVHATGQVVAFDIPIRLLRLGMEGGKERIGDNNDDDSTEHDNLVPLSISNSSCKEEKEEDGDVILQSSEKSTEALSEHCIQHLREAYHALVRHIHSQKNNNESMVDHNHDDDSVTPTSNPTKGRTKLVAPDQWQIRRALLTRLPCDIVVRSVKVYSAGEIKPFEPRKDVKCKTYVYKLRFRRLSNIMRRQNDVIIHPICNSGPHLLRRITDQNTVWLCPWALDPELLRTSCSALVGKHDFVNFVHKDERKKRKQKEDVFNGLPSTTRLPAPPEHQIDLFDFNVTFTPSEKDTHDDGGDEDTVEGTILPPVMDATFVLRAKGFQRSMVRNLVGFVVDVSRGLRSLDDIPVLLLKKDEGDCVNIKNHSSGRGCSCVVNSAPACGLCLAVVEYDHNNFV